MTETAAANRRPARIALIADGVYAYDAISAAILDSREFLRQPPGWHVDVLANRSEIDSVPVRVVDGLGELLLAEEFLAADLLIYHFGIWDPLFDALLVGNGRARQAVVFHNVTPAEFVSADEREVIGRSFVQLNNLRRADQLWPVSRTNAELLREYGFDPARIAIIPLSVPSPAMARLADKPAAPVELLFVGRIVPSKGLHDLIAAASELSQRDLPPFRLRILGNVANSEAGYCERIQRSIAAEGLGGRVEFIGTVDDPSRDRLLRRAQILAIPSYHEGFCKPVIEALRAGCVPVGYAAHNLRYIADGLCRMVPPGDVGALCQALNEAIVDVARAAADPAAPLRLDRGQLTAAEFAAAALTYVGQFEPDHIGALVRRHAADLLSGSAG